MSPPVDSRADGDSGVTALAAPRVLMGPLNGRRSMKIGENKPVRDVGSVQRAGAKPAAGQETSSASQRANDTVDVLGIPPNEFTPKVQQAIMTLMAEVEKLRRELQQTQARIADLEQLADQDPLAPIANRRAFVRELSRMLSF